LPLTIEQPTFLADPSHRKRVFARAVYNLAAAPKKTSKVTKGLAGHLKYCYGACIKRNRHLPKEELSRKVYNVLDHICNIHENCDVAWCYDLKARERNQVYVPPADHRIDKNTDHESYLQLKNIFDQYASVEMMAYCNHFFDTQTNESLNESIANVAPKNVCYSNSVSLFSRVALVIGCHNLGYSRFFHDVFDEIGMSWTSTMSGYLNKRDKKKEKRKVYQQKFEVKLRRSQQQKKSREEVYKERVDKSYGPGVALTSVPTKKRKAQTETDKTKRSCKCGSTTHQRTTHKDCPLKHGPQLITPLPNMPPTTSQAAAPPPQTPWLSNPPPTTYQAAAPPPQTPWHTSTSATTTAAQNAMDVQPAAKY